jgi:hypothetical protein
MLSGGDNMDATLSGIITGVALLAIGGAISLIKKYRKKKVVMSEQVNDHERRIVEIEKTQPLIVEGMFMLLQSAKKKGEINGESDGLMRRFEDHLFNRKG